MSGGLYSWLASIHSIFGAVKLLATLIGDEPLLVELLVTSYDCYSALQKAGGLVL